MMRCLQRVDPPVPIADGVEVRALEMSTGHILSVVGMVTVETWPRLVSFPIHWLCLELASGRRRADLETDLRLLQDPVCRRTIADGLRLAYGLAQFDATSPRRG